MNIWWRLHETQTHDRRNNRKNVVTGTKIIQEHLGVHLILTLIQVSVLFFNDVLVFIFSSKTKNVQSRRRFFCLIFPPPPCHWLKLPMCVRYSTENRLGHNLRMTRYWRLFVLCTISYKTCIFKKKIFRISPHVSQKFDIKIMINSFLKKKKKLTIFWIENKEV